MQLGDRFSVEKDGVLYTDIIDSVRYTSGSPAIYRDLNRWQSMIRRLTPRRWRKSLLVRAAVLPSVTINSSAREPVGKTLEQLERMKGALDRMI